MTPEVIVIATIRIVGSLPVLRWPFLRGMLALLGAPGRSWALLLLFPNVFEFWFMLWRPSAMFGSRTGREVAWRSLSSS